MIANQVVGRSFKGALAYIFGKNDAEFLSSNLANHPENGINSMASEFLAVCSQRPNLSRNVAHIQMSANPADSLDAAHWESVIKHWMKEMGYENCLYTAARHSDTANDHVHIVISRVDLDGKTVKENNNYAQNLRVTRELEQHFGLVPTVSKDKEKPTPKWQRDKPIPPNDYIKEAIKSVSASQPNMPDFIKSLAALDIYAEIKFSSKEGIAQGISFKYKDYAATGSKLGYSLSKIIKSGVEYKNEYRQSIEQIQARNTADAHTRNDTDKAASSQPASGLAEVSRKPRTGIAAAIQRVNERDTASFDRIKTGFNEFINSFKESINRIRQCRDIRSKIDEIRARTSSNRQELEQVIEVFKSTSEPAMKYKRELGRRLPRNRSNDNSMSLDND